VRFVTNFSATLDANVKLSAVPLRYGLAPTTVESIVFLTSMASFLRRFTTSASAAKTLL